MAGYGNTTDLKTRMLTVTYGLFLIGFFFLPDRSPLYLFYYLAVLPLFLSSVRYGGRQLFDGRLLLIALGYILYMTLSTLWSESLTWNCAGFLLARGVLTASFLLLTALLLWRNPETFFTLLKVVTLCAALSGLISVAVFYGKNPFPAARMISFAQIDNPNTLGVIAGLFALLAVNFVLTAVSLKARLLHSVAAIVLSGVVLLTQSRNAFLATSIGVLALFSRHRGWRNLFIGVPLLALLTALSLSPLAQRFGDGDLMIRTEIWTTALTQIATAPLFGHGQCSNMQLPTDIRMYTHPHSVYLAATWYGGVVGLLLLLALLIGAFRQALEWRKQHHETLYLSLVTYVTAAISVDFGSIVTRPREPWLYFWLPLALTVGLALRKRDSRTDHSQ